MSGNQVIHSYGLVRLHTGMLPDGGLPRADNMSCPPARGPPAVSPAFLDDWPVLQNPLVLALSGRNLLRTLISKLYLLVPWIVPSVPASGPDIGRKQAFHPPCRDSSASAHADANCRGITPEPQDFASICSAANLKDLPCKSQGLSCRPSKC